jgi:predicted phosphohydrolase
MGWEEILSTDVTFTYMEENIAWAVIVGKGHTDLLFVVTIPVDKFSIKIN